MLFDSDETKQWKQFRVTWKTTESYRILYGAIGNMIKRRFSERQMPPLKNCVMINPGQLSLGTGLPGMKSVQSMMNLFDLAAFTCIQEAIDTEQRAFTKTKVQALAHSGHYDAMSESALRSAGVKILPDLFGSFEINDSFVYIKEALPMEIVRILDQQPAAILWERIAMGERWAPDQQEIVGKFFAGSQDPITIPLMAGARSTNSRQGMEFTRNAYFQWRLPGTDMPPEYPTKLSPGFPPNPEANSGGYNSKPPAYGFSSQPPSAPTAQLPRPTTIRKWFSRGGTKEHDPGLSDKPYG